jgi:hypothetical protein
MDNILELHACPICGLPKNTVAKINAIYKKGNTAEEIGLAYSLPIDSLSSHFSKCSLEPDKKERGQSISEDFSPKEKYEKVLANVEILLENAYESLQNPSYDEDNKFADPAKLQTSYAKLVDTYRSLIKDIENQKNEEIIIQGIIENILNPLMTEMIKMVVGELDSLKSELAKQGNLSPEMQALFTESFRKIGTKIKEELIKTIEKLYKFYKIKKNKEGGKESKENKED